MDSDPDKKRLFFGLEVEAPWPEKLPTGRILPEESRHLTLAFLGNTSWSRLRKFQSQFPQPSFRIGQMGYFDECLFFPHYRPRVVAWHIRWWDDGGLTSFQKQLVAWLREKDYSIEEREFLPHVTVARAPFTPKRWKECFSPLPMMIKGFHLYESVGGLRYEPLWSSPLQPPIEAVEHAGDLAFMVRGKTVDQLQRHAQAALAFEFPELLYYFPDKATMSSIEDVIIGLNATITAADEDIGCPFKAVSFHGDVHEDEDHILQWEMIVDV